MPSLTRIGSGCSGRPLQAISLFAGSDSNARGTLVGEVTLVLGSDLNWFVISDVSKLAVFRFRSIALQVARTG